MQLHARFSSLNAAQSHGLLAPSLPPNPTIPQDESPSAIVSLRWLRPLAVLALLTLAGWLLHQNLGRLHLREILEELHAIPRASLLVALGLTAISYWVLGFYDLLGLRYAVKAISYARTLFTSFIAFALGNNLSLAAFTGAAVRLRLYTASGLTAVEVATVSGFCSLTMVLGLTILSAAALVLEPQQTSNAFHLSATGATGAGSLLFAGVAAYVAWASRTRNMIEIRGWALRPPGLSITLSQLVLGATDISLAAAVLWVLLPPEVHIDFLPFAGIYAVAMTAGLLSQVPGGLGVFEALLVLTFPAAPMQSLLGSLLAYRAIYYLVPLVVAALLFLLNEILARGSVLLRAHRLTSAFIAPVVPQVVATLTFVAGTALLFSGATPAVHERLAVLEQVLPLSILEISHLAGSVIGLALLVLARALLRRVNAAYHIAFWLLVGGIAASLAKGFDFEEALLLALVLGMLVLGRDAFYRPTSIFAERFTPVWIVSVAGVIAASAWIGILANRHVDYSHEMWWTFAFDANAPRTLRALLAVVVLATAWALLNLLRPARVEPGPASAAELERARALIPLARNTLANVALTGDKKLLFSEDGQGFLMYQVAGPSWIALGDPVGTRTHAEELVWRLRELSDRHGARVAFYQVSAELLSLYVDLGLAALKVGEEGRVPLADFSLEGSQQAELRQAQRRAQRDGATFRVVPAAQVTGLLPALRRISDGWLEEKSVAEKHFSLGAFSEHYLQYFDVALVEADGGPVAFANLWSTGTRDELSVDLMRFSRDAPRGAMDYLFIELMLWARAQGYAWFNLGMAPLAGLERHPLAPAWHRVGSFVFRHGEHFYNFEGLRRYKEKFRPVWEPKYLAAKGGLTLPRTLLDISTLVSGGFRELFVK
jgi:phosphatidylglycerol lysyltransferase